MRNSLLKFALAASLILNLTVFATAGYRYYAQSRVWVSPFGKVMEKDRFLFEELSLKPEQLAAMKNKAISFRAEIDRRRQEIDAKRRELVALMRYQNPDKKAIDATIKEISIKQEEMQRLIASHMLDMKKSLDTGQQQKFFDLIESTMMTKEIHMAYPSRDGVQ
jgi:Spy/CpxP family protein refolding chaperone